METSTHPVCSTAGYSVKHWLFIFACCLLIEARLSAVPDVPQTSGLAQVPTLAAGLTNDSTRSNALMAAAFELARNGDPVILSNTIARTPWLLQARQAQDLTLLHVSSGLGNAAAVRVLVALGADVNASNWRGETPLSLALDSYGSPGGRDRTRSQSILVPQQTLSVAHILLGAGAALFPSDHYGNVLFGKFTWMPQAALFDFLITNAAPHSFNDGSQNSALHWAVLAGRSNAVAILLARPEMSAATNAAGLTALQALSENGGVPASFRWGRAPSIFEQTAQQREDIARFVLSRGVELDICSAVGFHWTNELAAILATNPAALTQREGRGRTALHWATALNDGDCLHLLLRAGAEREAKDSAGQTALDLAAAANAQSTALALVKAGASTRRGLGFHTPLHSAAQFNNTNLIAALLGAGAALNNPDAQGRTPLDLALESNREEAARFLAGRKAGLGTNSAMTPLHWSVQHQNLKLTEFFLGQGKPVNATNFAGVTPLFLAHEQNNIDLMEILLQAGAHMDARDNRGDTLLHVRARIAVDQVVSPPYQPGFLTRQLTKWRAKPALARFLPKVAAPLPRTNSMITFLFKHGADINATNHAGETPLHLAAQRKFAGTNALLEAGNWLQHFVRHRANLNAANLQGDRPLHYAVQSGGPETIDVLLLAGADVNATNKLRETALHQAAKRKFSGDSAVADAGLWLARFFNHGANVNAANVRGETALHHALEKSCMATAEALLHAGANASQSSVAGDTPLGVALTSDFPQAAVLMLKQHGAVLDDRIDRDGNTFLHRAADANDRGAMEALLAAGANANLTNFAGDAPIHVLAKLATHMAAHIRPSYRPSQPPVGDLRLYFGQPSVLQPGFELLVQHGASASLADAQGQTPLHLVAATRGSTNMAALLVAAGADVNARDKDGDTALHVASTTRGSAGLVEWLLAHGADRSITNVTGRTPLQSAGGGLFNQREATAFAPGELQNDSISDAARRGDVNIVRRFLEVDHSFANTRDRIGVTPLHWAASNGNTNLVRLLIEQGANVDGRRTFKPSFAPPFSQGTNREQRFALAREHMAANSDREFSNTPLQLALATGNFDAANMLIAWGAEVDAPSAAYLNDVERLQRALESHPEKLNVAGRFNRMDFQARTNGHSLRVPMTFDGTPLHFAVRGGALETLRELLDRGADWRAIDSSGQTPYNLALAEHATEATELLAKHGADLDLCSAAQRGDLPVVRKLLTANPALIKQTNAWGRAPLAIAARGNHAELVRELLSRGASRLAVDADGNTPLHIAAAWGQSAAARLLLDRATMNATNRFGYTPLHAAALFNHFEIAQELLIAGADANARTRFGCSPMHCCAYTGSTNLAALLLRHGAILKDAQWDVSRRSDGTVLHMAAAAGQTAMIEWLIRHNADVNATNSFGRTPLDFAQDRSPASPLFREMSRDAREAVVNILKTNGGVPGRSGSHASPFHYFLIDFRAR